MTRLSIAIFGNTNNSPFILGKGLRELGHRVRLVLNRKELLHRPESNHPEWSNNYPDWIVDCSFLTDEDIAYNGDSLQKVIPYLTEDVDLVLLNDTGPSLARHLHAPHIALLTGSDLSYYANFDSVNLRSSMWRNDFKRSEEGRNYLLKMSNMVALQRDGILGAEVVCYPQKGLNPFGDRLLKEIGVQDERRLMFYMANTMDAFPHPQPENDTLTILGGARVVYRSEDNPSLSEMDFKGTDILIHGFALYKQRGGQGVLRIIEKGQDVGTAKELISHLGIGESVYWLPEMPLTQFRQEVIASDIVCDQFGTSFPALVTTESFSLQRPVLANMRPDIFSSYLGVPLPGFHAKTAEEVASALHNVDRNRHLLASAAAEGRQCAERHLSPRSMAQRLLDKFSSHHLS